MTWKGRDCLIADERIWAAAIALRLDNSADSCWKWNQMSAKIASCAVTGQNLACFVAGRRPSRRTRRSQLACNATQRR